MNDNTNISRMSVNNVVELLASIYIPLINRKLGFSTLPTPFLWGPPGVGKSDAVKELAEIIEEKTSKHVVVTDIRLLLFSPVDLRGVPVADEEKQYAEWLKPRIFDLDDSEEVVNILFLDELTAAPQSVQAAAYQLTLDRGIGEHKLPDNTLIIAAGNRLTDHAVSYKMPSALANRLLHFEIGIDFKEWSKWAVENDVHPYVLGYLSFDSMKLYMEERLASEVAFPTPRSWMFVSNILNTFEETEDISKYLPLISGCIGMATAVEFVAWTKVYKNIPSVKDIFDGKVFECPRTHDAVYALLSKMVSYANKRETEEDGITLEELENVCTYSRKFPSDFGSLFVLYLFRNELIRPKLKKTLEFRNFYAERIVTIFSPTND